MAESLNGAVYLRNVAEKKYIYFSPHIESMTGYEAKEFTPEFWKNKVEQYTILNTSTGIDQTKEAFAAAFRRGILESWNADFRFQRKDGEWIWLNDQSVPFKKNGILYSIGMLTEITARKKSESMLQDSAYKLSKVSQFLLKLMSDGHHSLENDVKQGAELVSFLFEFSSLVVGVKSPIGKNAPVQMISYPVESGSFSPEEWLFIESEIEKRTQDTVINTSSNQPSSGIPQAWKNSARRSLYINDEELGCVLIRLKDVQSVASPEAQKQLELVFELFTILLKKNRDFQLKTSLLRHETHRQKYEALGMMAEGICHEYNNLFQGILWNVDFLMEATTDEERESAGKGIRDSLLTASETTKKMQLFAGSRQKKMENLLINNFWEEEVAALKNEFSGKTTVRLSNLLEKEQVVIHCVRFELYQVLIALVSNADESMLAGTTEHPTIELEVGIKELPKEELFYPPQTEEIPEGPYLYFSCKDQGVGISKDKLEKVFDPFYTTKFMGRGMGLSFVLGFVRTHRGCLKIQSVVNQGTTVELFLPVINSSQENNQ